MILNVNTTPSITQLRSVMLARNIASSGFVFSLSTISTAIHAAAPYSEPASFPWGWAIAITLVIGLAVVFYYVYPKLMADHQQHSEQESNPNKKQASKNKAKKAQPLANNETDIPQVDILLQSQQYEQAEELIKDQINAEPTRQSLYLKLLDVYLAKGDQAAIDQFFNYLVSNNLSAVLMRAKQRYDNHLDNLLDTNVKPAQSITKAASSAQQNSEDYFVKDMPQPNDVIYSQTAAEQSQPADDEQFFFNDQQQDDSADLEAESESTATQLQNELTYDTVGNLYDEQESTNIESEDIDSDDQAVSLESIVNLEGEIEDLAPRSKAEIENQSSSSETVSDNNHSNVQQSNVQQPTAKTVATELKKVDIDRAESNSEQPASQTKQHTPAAQSEVKQTAESQPAAENTENNKAANIAKAILAQKSLEKSNKAKEQVAVAAQTNYTTKAQNQISASAVSIPAPKQTAPQQSKAAIQKEVSKNQPKNDADIDPLIKEFPAITQIDSTVLDLELAEQFLALGEKELARVLINERKTDFNPVQAEKANKLLSKINS